MRKGKEIFGQKTYHSIWLFYLGYLGYFGIRRLAAEEG